jgi:hypothetical protein
LAGASVFVVARTRPRAKFVENQYLAAAGRLNEALDAYSRLAAMDGVAINAVPAALVGRYARCELLERREQRWSELRDEAKSKPDSLVSFSLPHLLSGKVAISLSRRAVLVVLPSIIAITLTPDARFPLRNTIFQRSDGKNTFARGF